MSSGGQGAGLHTSSAETLVDADRETAFTAVSALVGRLWPGRTAVVVTEAPGLLVHTVTAEPGGGDVDAWLTWELTPSPAPASDCSTRVRLVHDEADTTAGPPPELDTVLGLLVQALHRAAESAS